MVSSAKPNRCPTSSLEWSSRKANRYVLRPPILGPCSASPTHRSFGSPASNRPNTPGTPASGAPGSSRRRNKRSSVDSEGENPAEAFRIRATCAAVRAGFSLFSAAATSRTTASVRGPGARSEGTRASNPPAR